MAYVAGGHGAIDSLTAGSLYDLGVWDVTRFAGSDRYGTSRRLANHGIDEGLDWDNVGLATGEGFADALAGAVLQARVGSPLVLTPSTRLCTDADWAVRNHLSVLDDVTIFGGEGAVQPIVRRQIRWIFDEP